MKAPANCVEEAEAEAEAGVSDVRDLTRPRNRVVEPDRRLLFKKFTHRNFEEERHVRLRKGIEVKKNCLKDD